MSEVKTLGWAVAWESGGIIPHTQAIRMERAMANWLMQKDLEFVTITWSPMMIAEAFRRHSAGYHVRVVRVLIKEV